MEAPGDAEYVQLRDACCEGDAAEVQRLLAAWPELATADLAPADYDGYCTEDEFEAVQDYIDQIKELALNYRK